MTRIEIWQSLGKHLFALYVTAKKTFLWFLVSYIIPAFNFFIVWGVHRDDFVFTLGVLNIFIVTNACFLTSLIFLIKDKRDLTKVITIITLIFAVVLFSLSVYQIEDKGGTLQMDIFIVGALATFGISVFLGFISKYDESEAERIHRENEAKAESIKRAREAKKETSTLVGGKSVKL